MRTRILFAVILSWHVDPQMRPVIPKIEVHGLMEVKLGLL